MKNYISKVRYLIYTIVITELFITSIFKTYLSNSAYMFLQAILLFGFLYIVNKTLDEIQKLEKLEKSKKRKSHWITKYPNRF